MHLVIPNTCNIQTKSPSTRQRDKTRLTAFRNKKAASLVSQWLWILHLWTFQGCPPAIWIQLCPLPHLTPDPRTRMQMYLRTTSTPLSLLQPPSTPPSHHPPATTTAPTTSVSASQSLAFVSLLNFYHLRDLCPKSRSRRLEIAGQPTTAHLSHNFVIIVISRL